MNFENVIIIAILALIIGGALGYIIKAKKSGQKCIGCPYGKNGCGGSCHGCGNSVPTHKSEDENKA